jgi:hypothetical protein
MPSRGVMSRLVAGVERTAQKTWVERQDTSAGKTQSRAFSAVPRKLSRDVGHVGLLDRFRADRAQATRLEA